MTPTAQATSQATRMQPVARQTPAPETQRSIPFDYSFRFELKGTPDLIHRSTLTISVEAQFTAVSIGYGVVPVVTPISFGPLPRFGLLGPAPKAITTATLRDITFGELLDALEIARQRALAAKKQPGELATEIDPEAIFNSGIRLNPRFAELALTENGNFNLSDDVFGNLFQVVSAPSDEVQFLYALFDEGTGREFQSEPLLNTAGLGISDGGRPFRHFARPISFAPRSTIRMEVIEKSDFRGELHVSLHGYKVLGSPGSPTHSSQQQARRLRRR